MSLHPYTAELSLAVRQMAAEDSRSALELAAPTAHRESGNRARGGDEGGVGAGGPRDLPVGMCSVPALIGRQGLTTIIP